MNVKKVRCNWDERPAVIEWACKWPGATVWLCKFCYGDWTLRACRAPTVLWPAYVLDVQPGYEAFLEQVRKANNQLWYTQRGVTPVESATVTKELAALLKRKYDIDMKVPA